MNGCLIQSPAIWPGPPACPARERRDEHPGRQCLTARRRHAATIGTAEAMLD